MATELGQAYVQIMPSAKGISGSISKVLGPEAESAGKDAGEKSGGGFASAIKKIIAAAGIGAAVTKAINFGGELEQNLGGTEAVFGEFASGVQFAAEDAYKNMGLSASDYMATANKMGTLFQGSGQTQQKALEMTQDAMQRAADVASVMGVDTSAAMEAVAGAAKNNFTMMDNLGVAMNATSIQAYALEKGINFEWKTASEAEKSEVAMKMFMDRTQQYAGNFARESEETFSGSLGAMKASIQDVLATLSTGGDWGMAMDAFSSAVVTFASNLGPMIQSVVGDLPLIIANFVRDSAPQLVEIIMGVITGITNRIGGTLPDVMARITEGLVSIIGVIIANAPAMIEAAAKLMTGLASGITQSIPLITEKLPELISSLVTSLVESLPVFVQAGITLFTALIAALPEIISVIIAVLPTIINGIIETITTLLPIIIEAGIDLLTSLVDALPTIISEIVAVLPIIVTSITTALTNNVPALVKAGITLLTALVDALPIIINTIVKVLPTIVDSIIKALLGNLPLLIRAGVDLLTALVGALPEIILTIVQALPQIIDSICGAVIDNIPLIVEAGVSLFTSLLGDLPLIISRLIAAAPEIISSILNALKAGLLSFKEMGKQLLLGLGDGIKGAVGSVVKKAKEACANIVNSVKNFFGIRSPSRVFMGIGAYLDEGLADGISDNMKPVSKAMNELGELTTRSFESEIGFNAASPSALRGLTSSIEASVSGQSPENMVMNSLQNTIKLLNEYIKSGHSIVLDDGTLVGKIAPKMDRELGTLAIQKGRGV